MPYTSQELITNSYYLSGIVARNLQTPTWDQINDGLYRLNGFLNIKGSETKQIPYYQTTYGNFIAGQQVYSFPNLVEIDTFAFYLQPGGPSANGVRFEMLNISRYEQFAVPRPENVSSLPYSWHLERTTSGSDVYVYFIPNQNYEYILTGKYALLSTTLNQDLSTVFDGWYIEYLTYGLAIYLCEWNNIVPPPSVMTTFKEMEASLTTLSPIDFTLRKIQYFKTGGGLNWGDVNYGRGWRGTN